VYCNTKSTGPEEAIQEWSGHKQNGVSWGPPPENKKMAHFGVILRANRQDFKTDFVFLNDTFGILG
jgi:hypothetical protein